MDVQEIKPSESKIIINKCNLEHFDWEKLAKELKKLKYISSDLATCTVYVRPERGSYIPIFFRYATPKDKDQKLVTASCRDKVLSNKLLEILKSM